MQKAENAVEQAPTEAGEAHHERGGVSLGRDAEDADERQRQAKELGRHRGAAVAGAGVDHDVDEAQLGEQRLGRRVRAADGHDVADLVDGDAEDGEERHAHHRAAVAQHGKEPFFAGREADGDKGEPGDEHAETSDPRGRDGVVVGQEIDEHVRDSPEAGARDAGDHAAYLLVHVRTSSSFLRLLSERHSITVRG